VTAGGAAGLDDTLAALADPVRRQAVELLAERVLRQRGLVTETHPEFDARVRIYALRSAAMTELRSWLDTAERAWAEQLTAFAAHLEAES
jgi:hypothetical protein